MKEWIIPFAITVSYMVVAVILGVRAKGKLDMDKVANWGVGGFSLNGIVTFFLIGAGAVSAYTFMGAPSWVITRGVPVMYVIYYLVNHTYNYFFLGGRAWKLTQRHGYLSQAETIGARYNSKFVRMFLSLVTSVALIQTAMLQIVGCGYVFNVMSGGFIPDWLGKCLVTLAIFIYLYTSGLRAIGWTNLVQGVLMFCLAWGVGLFVNHYFYDTLSFAPVIQEVAATHPENLSLPGALGDWGPMFWTTSILVSLFSFWPTMWTMCTGAKNYDSMRNSVRWIPLYYVTMIPMLIVGFICLLHLPNAADLGDKAALTLSLEILPPVLAGLLGAGVLAASQSSAEPMIHGTTFTWTHDIIGPLFNLSEEKEGKLQRKMLIIVMFFVILPLAVLNPATLVQILLIGYGFTGQVFPVILGLFFWPRSTKEGAIAGLVTGTIALNLCSFVWVHPLGIHGGIWGLAVNLIVHIVVSLLTKPENKETLSKFFDEHTMTRLYVKKEV